MARGLCQFRAFQLCAWQCGAIVQDRYHESRAADPGGWTGRRLVRERLELEVRDVEQAVKHGAWLANGRPRVVWRMLQPVPHHA
jgi:hypothetical protein